MRGPNYAYDGRAGQFPPQANEANSWVYMIPPPIGGWNTSRSPALMPVQDALILDNIYPDINDLSLRKGHSSWATGLDGLVKSFFSYQAGIASDLFAATDNGVYDVTSSGAVGGVATACTDGDWYYINFQNAGGNWLIAVNGVDAGKLYDGTTWAATGITGVADTDLWNVCLHKRRPWFIEKETMDAWYLAADAITGAATRFRFGPVFSRGGYLVAQTPWTIDGGNGPDDYFASVTSEGELAVYAGTDPASASTWAIVGVYDVGKPLGRRCFLKYGGDVLYMSERGLFTLASLLQSTSKKRQDSISQKIDEAWKSVASELINNLGWQSLIYPEINAVVINVPITEGAVYHQYVMNDNIKSWCRFVGKNLASHVIHGNAWYGGGEDEVFLAYSGRSDDGAPVQAICAQAYNPFGRGMQKQPQLFRPILSVSGGATVMVSCDADFLDMIDMSEITFPAGGGSLWDSGLWDTALWSEITEGIQSKWVAVPAEPGYLHSFRIEITTSAALLSWRNTLVASRPCGIL